MLFQLLRGLRSNLTSTNPNASLDKEGIMHWAVDTGEILISSGDGESLKKVRHYKNVKEVSEDYTLSKDDDVILINPADNITLTLPEDYTGREYYIKLITTNAQAKTVTVTAQAGETIEGNIEATLTEPYEILHLIKGENDWYILGK